MQGVKSIYGVGKSSLLTGYHLSICIYYCAQNEPFISFTKTETIRNEFHTIISGKFTLTVADAYQGHVRLGNCHFHIIFATKSVSRIDFMSTIVNDGQAEMELMKIVLEFSTPAETLTLTQLTPWFRSNPCYEPLL